MLAAIAKDDLLVGEIGAIGEQNPLAQNTLLKFPVGFLIRSLPGLGRRFSEWS